MATFLFRMICRLICIKGDRMIEGDSDGFITVIDEDDSDVADEDD